MSTKRILSLVLTLTLILGSFSFAFADHNDATLTTEQKVAELVKLGFVEGDELGNLNLDKKITRAEISTIIAKAVISGGEKPMDEVKKEIEKSRYQSRFSDVPVSQWYNPAINVAVQEGIVVGYPDNTFRPANNVTYAEAITMMVGILKEHPSKAISWPDNYIAKARELQILEGVDVVYTDEALREGVFELLYNTLVRKEIGQYNIDKVIVLENNRVEALGQNQIVVEVIKEIQKAQSMKDSEKAHRGEQIRLTVPTDVAEVEHLLGKVVDVKYDAKNNAVHFELDDSYQYVSGKIALNEKSIDVDGKVYTVLKGEQYKDNDERIYNTYVNNDAYSYDEAYKTFSTLDFGKATIKNGRVVFVDGFSFEDIAPVKEVKNLGNEIVVYNDLNDGGVKTIMIKDEAILGLKDGKVTRINKSDIKANDVVHVAKDIRGNNVIVVRQDALVDSTFTKVIELRDKIVVQTADGKEYTVLDINGKRPVFTTNGVDFYTLNAKQAASVLSNLRNEKVTILVDANGNLQLIQGVQLLGEAAGLTERVVGNQARVIKKDNTKADYTANLNTKFDKLSRNTKVFRAMDDLERGDLVFVSSNKEALERVTLLSQNGQKGDLATVNNTNKYISQNGQVYRVFDKTNIFVRNDNGDLFATDLANVANSATAQLRAVVITDADFAAANPGYVYDKNANIVHSVVFTDIDIKKEVNSDIAEVISISNRYEQIEVRFANGETKSFDINKSTGSYDDVIGTNGNRVMVGDIVEIETAKTDVNSLQGIKVIIPIDVQGKRIVSYNARTKLLKLANDSNDYYVTSETANFVKGNLEAGRTVALDIENVPGNNTTKFIKAIAERTATTPVVGKGKLVNVLDEQGKIVLQVDNGTATNKLYQFIGSAADLAAVKNLVGSEINFDLQTLNGVEYAFNVVRVGDAPGTPGDINKTVLGNLITASNTIKQNEAAYTTASFAPFNTALTQAALVFTNNNATQAQIEKAYNDLRDARTNLVEVGKTTITAANVDTKVDVLGMLAIKVDFPIGVTNVKVTKVGDFVYTANNSLTDGLYKNFPGDKGNAVTFTFDADGVNKTVTITK